MHEQSFVDPLILLQADLRAEGVQFCSWDSKSDVCPSQLPQASENSLSYRTAR